MKLVCFGIITHFAYSTTGMVHMLISSLYLNVCDSELFYTERTHLRELRVMQLLFYRPLMKSEIEWYRNLANLLFPSLSKVIQVHG